jgi:hypothetical protein
VPVTSDDLRAELNAGPAASVGGVPEAILTNCIAVADEVLKEYAGDDYRAGTNIPVIVAERAWLAVAVEIFNQRKAPNGVLNQAFTSDGTAFAQAVRIGSDPLRPAYGLLKRFLGTGIA